MVESRDKCTGDHVFKTAAYTEIILRQMKKEGMHADKLTEEYIGEVVNSAPLHDVGKITVSDVILNKPGRLTDEEFRIMQSHTVEGGKIIDKAIALVDDDSGYLAEAKNLALYHHEKWNGKGYPTGLSGEDIPLSARVMAVADVFDALVSRRSYKEPFSVDKALDIIREDAGTHFDPDVARAFINAQDEVRRVAKLNMEP
jgi:HD-GYP domain-containing protein (c-di-GMP phosphodiesterase class II)